MIVMQIVSVQLKPRMNRKLSHFDFGRVENWLRQWTCRANFKAVIEPTQEEALEHCRQMLREQLVPSWLASESKITPGMFTFRVADQEAKDNEFWMSSQAVWAHDREIGEAE